MTVSKMFTPFFSKGRRLRASKAKFLWVETDKWSQCTYCRNVEDLEKDFGKDYLEGKSLVKRLPLYKIKTFKYRENAKFVKSNMYKSGFKRVNTDTLEVMYTFNTSIMYRMAYSLAKRFKERVQGGKIKVSKDDFGMFYGNWTFRLYDYRNIQQYGVSVISVVNNIFQPVFKKAQEI